LISKTTLKLKEKLKLYLHWYERKKSFRIHRFLKDHPHIMKLYEIFEQDNCLYIISEILEGGDLLDKINNTPRFTEEKAALIMSQLLSAVAYCHKHKIVHR